LGQAALQLLGDLGEHLVGIQRGDGVSRNSVEQREVARLGALFLKQPCILNGDARFAGQHAHQFEMPFVKGVVVI
jgi:hypothetical protein